MRDLPHSFSGENTTGQSTDVYIRIEDSAVDVCTEYFVRLSWDSCDDDPWEGDDTAATATPIPLLLAGEQHIQDFIAVDDDWSRITLSSFTSYSWTVTYDNRDGELALDEDEGRSPHQLLRGLQAGGGRHLSQT